MNCIKCGASLVKGQTICSICGTTNSNNDYFSQHSSEIVNQYNQSNVGNMQYQEDYTDQKSIKKQNVFLRIASIFALLGGAVMLVTSISNIFISAGINHFNMMHLLSVLTSVLFVFYAFLLSNFNIGKSKLYDNKALFIIFLIINVITAFVYNLYFIILIFSIIGFIVSLKKEDN